MGGGIYVQKVFELIKDCSNFKEVSTDPTITRDGQLQRFLRSTKDKQIFAKETYKKYILVAPSKYLYMGHLKFTSVKIILMAYLFVLLYVL